MLAKTMKMLRLRDWTKSFAEDLWLKPDEVGVLFIREGHTVQFPQDIEVFSIVPPVLDEIHRWQRDQQ